MNADKKFRVIGIYFILLEALFFLVFFSANKLYPTVFWACNIVPIFLALGFLAKDFQLIKAVINFEFIPQLIFVVATILYFTTNISLFGINSNYTTITIGITAILLHAFSVNVALFYTRNVKPTKKSLLYGVIVFLLIYILSLLFTSTSQNVNYIYSSSEIFGFEIPGSVFIWPIFVFIFLVYPIYFFQKYLAERQ